MGFKRRGGVSKRSKLKAAAAAQPSTEAWATLCKALAVIADLRPKEADALVDEIEAAIAHWPDELRVISTGSSLTPDRYKSRFSDAHWELFESMWSPFYGDRDGWNRAAVLCAARLVRHLAIFMHRSDLFDTQVCAFLDCKHNRNLKSVAVVCDSGIGYGDDIVQTLAESPHLENLTSLLFDSITLDEDALKTLLSRRKHLRTLEFNNMGDDREIVAMLEQPEASQIEELVVEYGKGVAANRSAALLARYPAFEHLETLLLDDNAIDADGRKRLSTSAVLRESVRARFASARYDDVLTRAIQLASKPSSKHAWEALCGLFDEYHNTLDLDELDAVVSELDDLLADWPAAVRRAPYAWWDAIQPGSDFPAFSLVRTVEISPDDGVIGDVSIERVVCHPRARTLTHLEIRADDEHMGGIFYITDSPVMHNPTFPASTRCVSSTAISTTRPSARSCSRRSPSVYARWSSLAPWQSPTSRSSISPTVSTCATSSACASSTPISAPRSPGSDCSGYLSYPA